MAGTKLKPVDIVGVGAGVAGIIVCKELAQFEHIYGVGGKAGNLNGEFQPGGNPFEGRRSREYPNPSTTPSYAGSLFAEATKSLGYKPFSSPTSAQTRAYKNPYGLTLGQCVRGGYCSGFIGGGYVSVNAVGVSPLRYHPVPSGTPRWGSGWKKAVAQYYNRTFNVLSHGGGQSFRANYLQSWDVPNVFVIGASAFPQNSANKPVGTVGALACWTADSIKDLYLKQPRALV
ncbi:MAG: hypothetical protein HY525_14085 [Betaproteobacteria bacterium]|nr:hypothetical protein [Betaproteobacteria bacterium]